MLANVTAKLENLAVLALDPPGLPLLQMVLMKPMLTLLVLRPLRKRVEAMVESGLRSLAWSTK